MAVNCKCQGGAETVTAGSHFFFSFVMLTKVSAGVRITPYLCIVELAQCECPENSDPREALCAEINKGTPRPGKQKAPNKLLIQTRDFPTAIERK